MMIFFLSTCYLDLDLAGSGFGSCYLRCVCMCFIVQCIWLHFVQLVMAHDLCSVNIKSVTFLYIFMAFYSFKNSMNFFFVLWKPIKCARNGSGFLLYLVWIHIAVFMRFFRNGWVECLALLAHQIHRKHLLFCFLFFVDFLRVTTPERITFICCYVAILPCTKQSIAFFPNKYWMQWKIQNRHSLHISSTKEKETKKRIPF